MSLRISFSLRSILIALAAIFTAGVILGGALRGKVAESPDPVVTTVTTVPAEAPESGPNAWQDEDPWAHGE